LTIDDDDVGTIILDDLETLLLFVANVDELAGSTKVGEVTCFVERVSDT